MQKLPLCTHLCTQRGGVATGLSSLAALGWPAATRTSTVRVPSASTVPHAVPYYVLVDLVHYVPVNARIVHNTIYSTVHACVNPESMCDFTVTSSDFSIKTGNIVVDLNVQNYLFAEQNWMRAAKS